MNRTIIVAIIALGLIAGECDNKHSHQENSMADRTDYLDDTVSQIAFIRVSPNADVAADFEEAVKAGDLRFVGVMGYAVEVPGVPDYRKKYSTNFGVKIIEGTTDSYTDSLSLRYAEFYGIYAENYNRLLLDYLSQHPLP